MAAEAKAAQPNFILAPLPEANRGYGIHIDGHAGKKLIAYANGAHIFVRSIENPALCTVFSGHRGAKCTVAKFSPSGEWVCSGDDTGRIFVWGTGNKIVKNEVKVNRKVLDIAWSFDNERIIAAGDGDVRARVFGRDSSNSYGDIIGHNKPILTCAFKPSRPFKIVTGGEDNLVCFHTGPPFTFGHSFSEHTRYVNCVRYSPDGKYFVSVGSDSKIFLFDGAEGKKIKEIESKDQGHKGSIFSVSWSPDSKKLLTASGDKTAKIWNVESGSVETTFVFPDVVDNMQVSALWCGDHILSVSLNGAINFLDVANPQKPKSVIQGHQVGISALAADQKTGAIYSGDANGYVMKWDAATGAGQWFAGKASGKGVQVLSPSPDGATLATGGYDDKIRFNNANTVAFSDAAIAAGGVVCSGATGKQTADLGVFGISQGKVLVVRKNNIVHTAVVKYKPSVVALSPDESEVAVAGDDKKVHIFTLKGDALTEIKALTEHTTPINALTYSPDGKFLVSGETDRYIYVYDRNDGFKVKNPLGWQYHTGAVTGLAWTPSGNRVLSVAGDSQVIAWGDTKEFSTDNRYQIPQAHPETVTAVAAVSDDVIATAGSDKVIRVWPLPAK